MFKTIKFIMILCLLISLFSCGRKGSYYPNHKPFVRITSFEGVDDIENISDSIFFQQKIYWDGHDDNGVVYGFAFRILDEDENPIATPGYEFINDEGWVYHYQIGADESIPMNDPGAKLSIWTQQFFAIINFPANLNGESSNLTSIFEIKCIDNLSEESEIERRYFYSYSSKPEVVVQSTKGEINGKTIGKGIILKFNTIDYGNGTSDQADYYEFKLIFGSRDEFGQIIPGENYEDTGWFDTRDQPDRSEYLLNQNTEPVLNPNEIPDSTFVIARAINYAGIVSESDTIAFFVRGDFSPGAVIYNSEFQEGNDVRVLGQNHYTTYLDEKIGKVIESEYHSSGEHFSTPFWIDKDGKYAAVHSNDLKIYLHWGWHGEYGTTSGSGFNITDNPDDRRIDAVVDEQTDISYFAEIVYFDLRLDDEPYYYPPFPPEGDNLHIDNDGKQWLRVPINHRISRRTVLTGLDSNIELEGLEKGVHKFEVSPVDIQNVCDETPAVMYFKIVERVPANEKSGILILDDDDHFDNFSPDNIIDDIYFDFCADYEGEVIALDRNELMDAVWNSQLHFGRAVFSPTDLEKYKLVIYHSDLITYVSNFADESEILRIYLEGGGNLLISTGANLKNIPERMNEYNFNFMERYFGIPSSSESIDSVFPTSFGTDPYFIKAIANSENYNDIDLEIPGWNTLIGIYQGLGPVSRFNSFDSDTEVIFKYGCKPAESGNFSPSIEKYNELNEKPVALKKVTGNNNCYLFGFPLSYLDVDQVKEMINQILSEL